MEQSPLQPLRYAMTFIWAWSALVSLFIVPEQALALLQAIGIAEHWRLFILWSAGLMDLALALLYFSPCRYWRSFYALQLALVLIYSAIMAWALPETIWQPLAPLMKNVPILAVLFVLYRGANANKRLVV